MPVCPSCGSEFRAGFTECNTCRIPLVDSRYESEAESEAVEDRAEETLQVLGTLDDDAQAILLRRLLDDAGIPSVMQGGHASHIGDCVPYRVLVDEDYLEAARETVAAYRSPGLITGQIEGNLGTLANELKRLGREQPDLTPVLRDINESIEGLRARLDKLNRELDDQGD